MIVVSGWQKKKEDYKRAVGVVPSEMTDRERITRYYSCHCPDRLPKIDADLESFANDLTSLFDELQDLYGHDPREDTSLVPPKKTLQPLPYAKHCLEDFLVEFNKQAQAVANKSSTSVLPLSPSKPVMEEDEEEGKMSYVVNGSKTTLLGSWDEENIAQLLATAEKHRRGGHGGDGTAEAATESQEDAKQPGKNSEDEDDDSPCWHWQNLPESQAYSLYLLRWETELQLELGHSISSMIRSLGASAVQDVLSVTVLTTLAAAAFWPVLLLQLTSIIDNLWTIAVERADLAGKELARALLNREHGSRPVTLVGYSMGARVIFSCLRELAHQLHQDINFYEEEVEAVPGSVNASAEDDECAVQPNANADDNPMFSVFFTAWNVDLLALYFFLASVSSIIGISYDIGLRDFQEAHIGHEANAVHFWSTHTLRFGYAVQILYEIAGSTAFFVTVIAFVFLNPEFQFWNVSVHFITSMVMLLELSLNNINVRWEHMLVNLAWALIYLIFCWPMVRFGAMNEWPYFFLRSKSASVFLWYIILIVVDIFFFYLFWTLSLCKYMYLDWKEGNTGIREETAQYPAQEMTTTKPTKDRTLVRSAGSDIEMSHDQIYGNRL
eukprot:gene3161-2326_t